MSMIVDYYVEKINKILDHNVSLKQNKELQNIIEEIRELHPADLCEIFDSISNSVRIYLFSHLPSPKKADVFIEFSNNKRHNIFLHATKNEREALLHYLSINELVDFFDDLSDEEIREYIQLLNKKERKKVLSLLEFPETSAAGIMESDVIVLPPDISTAKTILLLKKTKANKTLYKTIYIVNHEQILIGYILLEDLFFAEEKENISKLMKPAEYFVKSDEDQETVSIYMTRYKLSIIPVIDHTNHFLGVITSEIVARTIELEAAEDIFRMASLSPIQYTYFETPMTKLIWQRASILTLLLLLQSISTMIIGKYTALLNGFLITYIGMVTSTGGNTSSQVSALVIQGLASGDIKIKDQYRFLKREIIISSFLAIIVSIIGSARIYFFHYQIKETIIIFSSLFSVILFSTILGSAVPFILHKVKVDPAYSAGPLLATCMDILGVILFTTVIYIINMLIM